MVRPPPLLFLLGAAVAPWPAAAQIWPPTHAAAAPWPPHVGPPRLVIDPDRRIHRPGGVPPTQPTPPHRPAPHLATPKDAPEVTVPARPEWFDDQGFRIADAGVAWRRRF